MLLSREASRERGSAFPPQKVDRLLLLCRVLSLALYFYCFGFSHCL